MLLERGIQRVTVDRARWPGYDLAEGRIPFTLAESVLDIPEGSARLNGGPSTFRATVDLSAEPPAYDLDLDTNDVRLARSMESEARLLAPFFGDASGFSGLLTVEAEGLSARGRGRDDLLRDLSGTVRFEVSEGTIEGSPLLGAILGLVLMITGVVLTVTILGAPIGIPLTVFGFLLVLRSLF